MSIDPKSLHTSKASATRKRVAISLGNLKPLSEEAHQRMREAARDQKVTARQRFPVIKT